MKQFTIPSGMRDQILGECEIKKQLQLKIESSLDKWGYKEVITPTIEFYKTYEEGFRDIKEQGKKHKCVFVRVRPQLERTKENYKIFISSVVSLHGDDSVCGDIPDGTQSRTR